MSEEKQYIFDRYRGKTKMAEGARVHAVSEIAARILARSMFTREERESGCHFEFVLREHPEVTRLQAEVERLTKERDEKPLPPLSGRVIDCPHCFKSVQLAWIQDEKDAKIAELEAKAKERGKTINGLERAVASQKERRYKANRNNEVLAAKVAELEALLKRQHKSWTAEQQIDRETIAELEARIAAADKRTRDLKGVCARIMEDPMESLEKRDTMRLVEEIAYSIHEYLQGTCGPYRPEDSDATT